MAAATRARAHLWPLLRHFPKTATRHVYFELEDIFNMDETGLYWLTFMQGLTSKTQSLRASQQVQSAIFFPRILRLLQNDN